MIRIIQGVYGHQINGRVYPKDSNSEPFELTPKQEERLVEQKVAVYVDDGSTKLPEGVVGIPEYSVDMKAEELRTIGKELGLTFKAGTTKAEMVEQMDAFLSENTDDEEVEDGDELPEFDAAEAVE